MIVERRYGEKKDEKKREGRTLYFLLLGPFLPLLAIAGTALPSSSENFLEMSSSTTLSSTLRNFNVEDAVQDFLSLECHTLQSAYNAAVISGVLAISTHLVVSQLCKLLGNKLVAKDSGFAAHQFVAMYNMLLLFFVGGLEWTHASMPPTASDRLFELNPKSLWLASITLGQLLCWDIPCGFGLVKSMKGDMIMLAHHVIMACVAWAGMFYLPSFYYLFFFGFCELSSIPLAIVDFFHPKHFAALTEESKLLAGINGIARISFAVLFLLVRAVYFPYVYASMLVPDLFELLGKPYQVSQQKTKMMWMIFGASTSLTLLQLYWAKLVTVQVIKLLFPGNEKKAK